MTIGPTNYSPMKKEITLLALAVLLITQVAFAQVNYTANVSAGGTWTDIYL